MAARTPKATSTAALPAIPAQEAAALFLHAQGMLDPRTRRSTPKALHTAIHKLGYVQVDSINVVARAHDMILRARFSDYTPAKLARLTERDRSLFENWVHDAAVLPVEFGPQWQHRFRQFDKHRKERMSRRSGARSFGHLCGQVKRRIAAEGPLSSSDFEDARAEAGGWWNWKPAKVALEYLWRTGALVVAHRTNFQKHYDLTERALPALAEARPVTRRGYIDWACREALDRLGSGTYREIAAYWDGLTAPDVRAWSSAALLRGDVVAVQIEDANGVRPAPVLAVPDWRERLDRVPAAPAGVRVLSPFDPVVRERDRLLRLFGFAYRFEAFVPQKKRQDGYYVTPLWRGTRPIGRFDPKFDRATGTLVVKGLRLEDDVKASRSLTGEIDDALDGLRAWLGAEKIRFEPGPRGQGRTA